MGRLITLLPKLCLSAVSFLLVICFVEFAAAPLAFTLVPMKHHAAFPVQVRVLTQSSKRAAVPQDYIAIVGDSYAAGGGDWLMNVDHDRNPPYHSAHVLRDLTGKDVVTFGAAGADSLRGLITEPFTTLSYLRETALYATDDPDFIVAYFYEGNDLSDNLRDLAVRYEPTYELSRIRDEEYFRGFIERTVIGDHQAEVRSKDFRWYYNFPFIRAVLRHARDLVVGREHARFVTKDWTSREVNRALVGGKEILVPDHVQAPALELTQAELDLALYVYERSLSYMRERFAEVPVLVVYLPSPISSYRITSSMVSIGPEFEADTREDRYTREEMAGRSDWICGRIREITRALGAGFVDFRPTVWSVTDERAVHGPVDWNHFNQLGHVELAETIAGRLHQTDEVRDECASLAAQLERRTTGPEAALTPASERRPEPAQ